MRFVAPTKVASSGCYSLDVIQLDAMLTLGTLYKLATRRTGTSLNGVISLRRCSSSLPDQSRVVICGGGVIGCSVAYHLTKLGWTDVLVLEQGRSVVCT